METSLSNWNVKLDSSDPAFGAAFRKEELLGRLLIGVCAEMSTHKISGSLVTSRPHRTPGIRKLNTFKLTRPVILDLRETVRSYTTGGLGNRPTVQTLVRGHWKMQPHGAMLTDRKFIHVEPYWRGPEEAPVAVRSYILGA